tara:strand:+ start:350 stop:523 length:174 start_codon:yes stop_codon:yes gene_type:complete
MAITIAENSIETVKRLLRNEFDTLKNWWQEDERKQLIQTAKDYSLPNDFINELQNDL